MLCVSLCITIATCVRDPAGLHQLVMVMVLFLTLMAGPVGVLAYFILKALYSLVKGGSVAKMS